MENLYPYLFTLHSYIRFVILALLIIVILKSLIGWMNKQKFGNADNKLALFLLISAHIQLLVGLAIYFKSAFVKFDSTAMKDNRYWTVEHIFMMIIAIALITVGKSSLKRLTTDESKFKRLFIMNTIALVIIIGAIFMSKRGLLSGIYL